MILWILSVYKNRKFLIFYDNNSGLRNVLLGLEEWKILEINVWTPEANIWIFSPSDPVEGFLAEEERMMKGGMMVEEDVNSITYFININQFNTKDILVTNIGRTMFGGGGDYLHHILIF